MTSEVRLPLLRVDSPASLTFTGERFVPGLAGARIAYEHLHRYAFARRFVDGRRVLDLGCGLGYGAEVLAPLARQVVALDRDAESIRQARTHRTHALGPFAVGDAARLPFRDAAFDAVIAFELIEHLTAQEAVVAEIRRVLPPSGVLLISSPDTTVYSGKLGQRNPFHPKEMTTEELLRLLEPHFEGLVVYKQRVVAGSLLVPEPTAEHDGSEVLVAKLEGAPPALVLDPVESDFVYNVVVCGPAAAVADAPGASILADVAETLTTEYEHWLEGTREVVRGLERSVKEWEAYAAQIIRDKDAYLEQVVQAKDERLTTELGERHEEITRLQAAVAALEDRLRTTQAELARAIEAGNASEAQAVGLHAETTRLEAELGRFRDDPVIRRYLGLRRLMRSGPLPSRRGA